MITTTIFKKVARIRFACLFFILSGIIGSVSLEAQTILYSESFDFVPGGVPQGWSVQNLGDAGPGSNPTDTLWRLTSDGTASGGAYWGDRQAIASPTGNSGAMVFNSDRLDNGGVAGTPCAVGTGVISCAPHHGALISPSFDASNSSSISLKFYQYYRGFASETWVDISTDGGNTWDSLQVNQDLADLPFGGETDRAEPVILNISAYAANQQDVRIRFRFKGEYYFWIIDDIFVDGDATVDDIGVEEIVWPDQDLICYLGERERIKIKVHNYGQTPQSNFDLSASYFLSSGAQGVVSGTYPGTLMPNESAVFTFDIPMDLRGLAFVDVGLVNQDGNPANDQRNIEVGRPCEICTDATGAEYICDQIVVQFDPATDTLTKKSLRESWNNAERIDVCGCDTLEIWRMAYPFEAPNSGDSIFGPEAVVTRLVQESEIEEAGVNHLLDLKERPAPAGAITYVGPESSNSPDTITVAILDTGLDFDHDSLKHRFWVNKGENTDPFADDSDQNCYPQDLYGANMIDPLAAPYDDSGTGHGTHVGGTVLNGAPFCLYNEIMTVKVVASNGRGTLFDIVCGMRYAKEHGADIINLSMGYQGVKDSVLSDAIASLDSAGILLITSAGNDSTDNDQVPHWPSNFTTIYNNVISVTSVDPQDNLSSFANSGNLSVDIATKGENIQGPVPGIGPSSPMAFKSGTSMATALVSRIASFYWALNTGLSAYQVRDFLLNNAVEASSLTGLVANKRRLSEVESLYLGASCLVSIPQEELLSFQSFPNPFDREVQLTFEVEQQSQFEIRIFNQMGQLIHQEQRQYPTGTIHWVWEVPNVANGLYLYQIFLNESPAQSGKWIKR